MEREILDGVIINGTADFFCVANVLRRREAGWCVIGGWAANAYAPPVYTGNLSLVVAKADLEGVLADLQAADFCMEEMPFSIRARGRHAPTSRIVHRLTVQFIKRSRYQSFVARAVPRSILGTDVPVAALTDVVRGKLWSWNDPLRQAGKHLKDQFDLLRLAEVRFDEVAPLLPDEIRAVAEADRVSRSGGGEDGWGDDWRGGSSL